MSGGLLQEQPLSPLHKFADSINYPVLMDEKKIEALMLKGGDKIHGREFPPYDPKLCAYRPFQHIYGHYEWEMHDAVFVKTIPEAVDLTVDPEPFTELVKLKIMYEMLRASKKNGGCGFNLTNMSHSSTCPFKSLFPLHDKDERIRLWKDWKVANTTEKYDEIRGYFGEKIALYFNFVGHMGSWLIIPSLIGLPLNLVVWSYQDFSYPVLPFYGAMLCLWSITMLEYWNRTSREACMRWGTLDFNKTEGDRPEFKADDMVRDLIKGELVGDDKARSMVYVFPDKQRNRWTLATLIVCVMILIVLGVVAGIYVIRFALENDIGTWASVVCSILNSVQIAIFNALYGFVSRKMTDYENQRTDSKYEDSMVTKLFVFQFVNSYCSFFFLAFIAAQMDRPAYLSEDPDNIESTYVGACGWSDCMKPLSINLVILSSLLPLLLRDHYVYFVYIRRSFGAFEFLLRTLRTLSSLGILTEAVWLVLGKVSTTLACHRPKKSSCLYPTMLYLTLSTDIQTWPSNTAT